MPVVNGRWVHPADHEAMLRAQTEAEPEAEAIAEPEAEQPRAKRTRRSRKAAIENATGVTVDEESPSE